MNDTTASIKRQKAPHSVKEAARLLIFKGNTAKSAASQLGLSYDQVRNWQSREKWGTTAQAVHSSVAEAVKLHLVSETTKQRVKDSARARRILTQSLEKQLQVLADSTPTLESMRSKGQGDTAVTLTLAQVGSIAHGWGKDQEDSGEWADLDALEPAIEVESVKTVQ